MNHTIFNDAHEQDTWATHLSFLFDRALRNLDLGPVKQVSPPDVAVHQRPDRPTTRVVVSFDVVPK
jgi:hypothetical protein